MKSNAEDKRKIQTASESNVVHDIKEILYQARNQAYSAVNFIMVRAYWLVGRRIITEEQSGKDRAAYGKQIIKQIADEISAEFDKNLSERRIREIRQFYLTFPFENLWHTPSDESDPQKWHSLSAEFTDEIQHTLFNRLSWTHIRHILRVEEERARLWYIRECAENVWSVRTLERNISSQYYQRLLASQVKEPVVAEMKEKTTTLQQNKYEFIKNPSVLEFLNLPGNLSHTENQIEKAIIDNL